MAELDLVLDTDPAQVNDKGLAQPNTAPAEEVDQSAASGEEAEGGDGNSDDKPADGAGGKEQK